MIQVSHLRMQAGVRIPFLSSFFLIIPFVVTRLQYYYQCGSFHNGVDTPCTKMVLSSAGRLVRYGLVSAQGEIWDECAHQAFDKFVDALVVKTQPCYWVCVRCL
jgi:hypothetical protein